MELGTKRCSRWYRTGERSRRQLVSLLRRLQKRYPVASIARAAKVTPGRLEQAQAVGLDELATFAHACPSRGPLCRSHHSGSARTSALAQNTRVVVRGATTLGRRW